MGFVTTTDGTLGEILRQRLIAVLRFHAADECLAAAHAVVAGGIPILEVTLTTPGAIAVITALSRRDGLIVGVGSVRSEAELDAAAMAGARFVASPHIDARLVERARGLGLVTMPGGLTPTEIERAWSAGADLVKVFPMPRDGAAYITSLLGPMPEVRLAPSGGVSPQTVRPLLDAGACALNVGSWMTHDNGSPATADVIGERARELVSAVRGVVV
jgi:2-dehydro-3-deoxyphosphogluconate aldolase / (4S)-4-hydroxy-2-oxoglutarate aldolase